MINLDSILFAFLAQNVVTLGLVLGLLGTIFKDSKIIAYLTDKIKVGSK